MFVRTNISLYSIQIYNLNKSHYTLQDMESNIIICRCMKVSLETIKKAISEGAVTVAAVKEKTGAGSGCGRCQSKIADIIEANK